MFRAHNPLVFLLCFLMVVQRNKVMSVLLHQQDLVRDHHVPFYNFPEIFKTYLSKIHNLYPEKFVRYFEVYGKMIEKEAQLVFLFPDLCHPNSIGHALMADILSLDDKFLQ